MTTCRILQSHYTRLVIIRLYMAAYTHKALCACIAIAEFDRSRTRGRCAALRAAHGGHPRGAPNPVWLAHFRSPMGKASQSGCALWLSSSRAFRRLCVPSIAASNCKHTEVGPPNQNRTAMYVLALYACSDATACRRRCTWCARAAGRAAARAARAAATRPRGASRAPPSRSATRRARRSGCAPSGARPAVGPQLHCTLLHCVQLRSYTPCAFASVGLPGLLTLGCAVPSTTLQAPSTHTVCAWAIDSAALCSLSGWRDDVACRLLLYSACGHKRVAWS